MKYNTFNQHMNQEFRDAVASGDISREAINPLLLLEVNLNIWEHNKLMVFPESEELLNKLLSSKRSISQPEAISPLSAAFIFCLPKGFIIAEKEVHAVLFTYLKYKDRRPYQKNVESLYHNKVSIEHPQNINGDERMLTMIMDLGTHYSSACIPESKLNECLTAKNEDDFIDVLGKLDLGEIDYDSPAHFTAAKLQLATLKLYIGMCLYIQAGGNEVLVDGMPVTKPGQVNFPDMQQKTAKKVTLKSLATNKKNPHAHYRSWHFRQLTDDRYYKGEYEGMEPGSRIVFVRDTYVGDKIKAKTLRDKK
ncbi:hypothetical protein GCM10023116_03990 [Kistimonas scapharcae]|uniref:Uncharacterized protein n=1 Tax=Kistimonas scapharcae TaxID=1036133 RepID=A0ABP8UWC1_9GAMM